MYFFGAFGLKHVFITLVFKIDFSFFYYFNFCFLNLDVYL